MPDEHATPDSPQDFIIVVMAKDRPGIIACITRTIFERGGSVKELSQTVMRGYFTIILSAAFPAEMRCETLRDAIEEAGRDMGLAVIVREADADVLTPTLLGGAYILTVEGDDQPGIIARMTSYLAAKGINIEDFYAVEEGGQFTMVLQIRAVDAWDADRLRLDLEAIGAELGIRAYLLHQDIFRVTSEVGAVRRLVAAPRAKG